MSRSPHGPTPGSAADDVEPADPVEVARTICLRQLTAAPKTRAQLAATLARRGVPDEAATLVLDRLGEVGLVDDGAYASAWVESRHRGRGLGRRALAHELRTRGVSRDVATAALEGLDPEQELEMARRLVARRLPGLGRVDRATATRRLAGMLARKGYPPGMVSRVVAEALAAGTAAADLDVGDEGT